MVTSRARWVVLAAVALLATAYVLPLWRVELIAPQYPEGLGMHILVDGVEGFKENDLNNINNLNHYIGMRAIEPDAIPALRWMPWILGVLIAGGLAVAAAGRRVPLLIWGGALGLLLVAGLGEYWRWGYIYGHDLDTERAIIKIPGMTYQPPLIGSKKILNFRATSWPASGGIALALAAGLMVFAVTGCGVPGPRALVVKEDQCAYCRMEITDPRFGTQVVLRTGKIQVFDAVECVAGFARGAEPGLVRDVWVTDAESEGTWVRADEAGYLLDSSLRPPMGRVVAFASPDAAARAQVRLGGTTLAWSLILADSAGMYTSGGH